MITRMITMITRMITTVTRMITVKYNNDNKNDSMITRMITDNHITDNRMYTVPYSVKYTVPY